MDESEPCNPDIRNKAEIVLKFKIKKLKNETLDWKIRIF